ncbi:MAG TPA: hypothetical protein VNO22_08575 [Planctomycetota bacterium]|nr:hypothetical protein [Planctomycetota bacterium]
MGQEIVYCCRCQVRLATGDFDKGRATRLGNRVACVDCLPGVLSALTPDERQEFAQILAAHRTGSPVRGPGTGSSSSLRALPSRPRSTARIRTVAAPVRSNPHGRLRSGRAVGIAVAAAAAAAFVAWAAWPSGNTSARTPQTRAEASPPARPPAPDPREREARAALERARRIPAEDLDAKIAAYAEAARVSQGTALHPEAEEAHKALVARREQDLLRELAALDEEARPLRERERFAAALAIYEGARARRPSREWQALLEARLREERARIETLFRKVGEDAAQARRQGDRRTEDELRARVAGWGLAEWTSALERRLAEIRPERPWRPLFDGRTLNWMSSGSRDAWEVVDGAICLKPGVDNAAQSKDDFEDVEFRIRFETRGARRVWFAFRQGSEGLYGVDWQSAAAAALAGGTRELRVALRGDEVTARLDGSPVPVEQHGRRPRRGRLQFNATAEGFRILSIEYREP